MLLVLYIFCRPCCSCMVRCTRLINPRWHYITDSVAQRTTCETKLSIFPQNAQKRTYKKPSSSTPAVSSRASGARDDEGSCMEWCRSVTECRAASHLSSPNDCLLESKTSLDVPVSDWVTGDSGFNLYQKMCA